MLGRRTDDPGRTRPSCQRQRWGLVAASAGLVLFSWPTWARADSVRIVSGGPRDQAAQARVVASLDRVQSALAVCWRGKTADAVTVELSVDPGGQVLSSRQKTPGNLAQCVAGVLAVQTLAATGARYQLSAAITPPGPGDSASEAGTIQSAVAAYRDKLEACSKRASKASWPGGQVSLRFVIKPDGSVAEPQIQASELGDAQVERCLLDVIGRAALGRGLTAKPVRYTLALQLPGASASDGSSSAADPLASGDLQPKKEGPLAGEAISTVMRSRKGDFSACYNAEARRDRSLAGRVVLRFTIRADGTVSNVQVRETTLGNAKVERCMVGVGKTLRFAAEQGRAPTRVFYPFVFSAK